MARRAILVSMPASNYVEKARWALQLAKIPFEEEKHAPLFNRLSTKPKGGLSVPLLYFPDTKEALTDSKDIVAHCAKTNPWLYATPEVKELELKYDTKLGPQTRRIAYFFLFHDYALAKQIIAGPVDGALERGITNLLLPQMKTLLFKLMKINRQKMTESMARVEALVAEVEDRLGDAPIGSRFLCGDSFTAADIAFCAHMSLLLGPPPHMYMSALPRLGADDPLQARIEKIQQSKASEFVYWCYKHKRPVMSKTTNWVSRL